MLALVSLPFFLQATIGRSEVETGLLLTPWPLATMVMAPLAGYLIEKIHAGLLGAIGLTVMACGLFGLALLPSSPSDLDIIWRMALCGAGFGLFQSPNNHTIVSSAPSHRSGGASGMLGTARLLGQSTGAALVALLFNLQGNGGTHTALLLAGGLAVVAATVSGLRVTSRVPDNSPPDYGTKKTAARLRLRFLFLRSEEEDYFRYSPLRRASIRLSSGGCVINSSLIDFALP
nr:transport protein [Raoultella sp. NCTC 9187]